MTPYDIALELTGDEDFASQFEEYDFDEINL